MKIFFNQKIIPGILIFFIFFSFSFSLYPEKAKAQWTVTEIGPNLVQSILNVGNTTLSSFTDLYMKYKSTVLDRLATIAAKQLIRYITSEVVAWINNGFKGSPAFLQNPGAFFLDVGDQITGEFIAESGGPLTNLCSGFSLDIRLALKMKFGIGQKPIQRYSCTLGRIVGNVKGAVSGLSSSVQGGWSNFVSVSLEPQNNFYGAYLNADSELAYRIGSEQTKKQTELSSGSGFLSWRDPECAKNIATENAKIQKDNTDAYIYNDTYGEGATYKELKSPNDCPVKTPGSVIAGSLQNNLNGPLRELELVDNINQIVNALFSQLILTVLKTGLSSSETRQKLDDSNKEINNAASPELAKVKTELTNNTSVYMKNTVEYKANRDEALSTLKAVKDTYLLAKTCYVEKIAAINLNRTNFLNQQYPGIVSEIDTILNTQVDPKLTTLQSLADDAAVRMKTLTDINVQTSTSNNIIEVTSASDKYADLLNRQSLTSLVDIQKSKEDLDNAKVLSARLLPDAQNKLNSCKSSP